MKVIEIRYLAPTNTKPSRWRVNAEGCGAKTYPYEHANEIGHGAYAVGMAYLAEKLPGEKASGRGQLANGDYVITLQERV